MGGVREGHLFRKRTVRNLNGDIIDMVDQANGGVIIAKGRVVNQERIDEMAKIEDDKRKSAQAITAQVVSPVSAEARSVAPSKIDALEKRIDSQDAKLDAILLALKK